MNLMARKKRPAVGMMRKVKSAGKRTLESFRQFSRKKKILVIIIILVVLALIGGAVWAFAGKKVNVQVTQTARAVKGSISNTVVGTGNLELGSSEDIEIPSGITIKEVDVESGDKVSKGDTLAKVDSASVLKVLSQTQDLISEVDNEINDTKGDTESSSITAGVSGRVKRIYAAEGDSVLESMTDHSALMLLSLDGKMAVSISGADGISAGDTVKAVLSDGTTQKTGTVESISDGNAVITLSDNGPDLGEKVTVTKGGSSIGTGKLYIHSQLAVVGTGGTVKSVGASENQYVNSGATLYKLKDMPASVAYQELLARRQELAKSLSSLVVMAQTNTITASKSGTIENVNVSSGSSSSSDSAGSDSESAGSSGSANAAQTSVSLDTGGVTNSTLSSDSDVISTDSESEPKTVWNDSSSAKAASQELSEEEKTTTISSVKVPVTAPVKGAVPQKSIAETAQYTGGISWNIKNNKFQADSTYTARITLTAKSGHQFTQASSVSVGASGAVISGISVSGEGEGNAMTFIVTFTKTQMDSSKKETTSKSSDKNTQASSSSAGAGGSIPSSSSKSSAGGSNSSVASSSSATGNSSSGSGSSESASSGEIETVAAFSFCSDEEMVLPVSVDELDILSVEKGQKASVTFDAIEGETFTGKITKVSSSASVNSGVAKYSVDITVPADDSMRVGMNGSATVTISSKADIILIPLNALQESGDKAFVYTEKDGDGNLSGKKEVQIGISDGENAEITSGLKEGDEIYYNKTGALTQNSSSDGMPGGGFGQDSGQGQQPPSGGKNSDSSGGRPGGSAPDEQ